MGAKIHYLKHLPKTFPRADQSLLIYDKKVLKLSPYLKKWMSQFHASYGVDAGEHLKDLKNFPVHFNKIADKLEHLSKDRLCVVSLGGGSVGDFSGFFSAVFKRGVELQHIPSTFLASIDSVHGGKNALNASGVKNILGTFHEASHVYIVEDILNTQPSKRAEEALAELYKVALLNGVSFYKRLCSSTKSGKDLVFEFMKEAIQAKYKILSKDYFEKRGHRQKLNLGHSMGHIFEAKWDLPHGTAVALGLHFAIEWSMHKKLLTSKLGQDMLATLYKVTAMPNPLALTSLLSISKKDFYRLASNDKKAQKASSINFIFIRSPGNAIVKEVTLEDFFLESQRQGWIV